MEAPKCKICGQRHYGICRLKDIGPEVLKTLAKPLKAVKRMDVATLPDGRTVLAHPEHPVVILSAEQSKTMFDRTAYQREYMRKRRAKQRATGQPGNSG